MRRATLVGVFPLWLMAIVACGGSSSPAAPSSGGSGSSGNAVTLRGRLLSSSDSAPVAGQSVDLGSVVGVATTGADGSWSVNTPPSAAFLVTLHGPSIVTRRTKVVGDGRAADVDAFRLDGQFDLAFYRQLVRNGFEAPGALEMWRPQPTMPAVFIRTVDEGGAAIPAAQLDVAETAIRSVVPLWTGGRYAVLSLQRGAGAVPVNALGITWAAAPVPGQCGRTFVGSLVVELDYKTGGGCSCNGVPMGPRTIKHELGHAFGFWHSDNPNDLMWHTSAQTCDADPSPRERYHAGLAYKRPFGNTDPDSDP